MKIKSAGLFGKYNDASVRGTINTLTTHLQGHGVEVLLGDSTSSEIEGPRIGTLAGKQDKPLKELIDIGIVIGGDGTMLNVARSLAGEDVPVVGINMGRLGFLTDIAANSMFMEIDRIVNGDYKTEDRALLQVDVLVDGETTHSGCALNDIVVSKGATARLIEHKTFVDNELVRQTRGDGIIVATPTGSTAYALSAGGPILHTTLPAVVLVPICPHALSNRPLVLGNECIIEIEMVDLAGVEANLALDGLIEHQLKSHELVRIRRAEKTVKLIRSTHHNHYEALRSKLGWV